MCYRVDNPPDQRAFSKTWPEEVSVLLMYLCRPLKKYAKTLARSRLVFPASSIDHLGFSKRTNHKWEVPIQRATRVLLLYSDLLS